MRRVAVVLLLLASGARASVVLPADVTAGTYAPAAAWQPDMAAAATGRLELSASSDMVDFSVPAVVAEERQADLLPLSVVPDVTSWALLLLGLAVVGLVARRRQPIVTA